MKIEMLHLQNRSYGRHYALSLKLLVAFGIVGAGSILELNTAQAARLCRGTRSAGVTHVPQGCGNKRVDGRWVYFYCDDIGGGPNARTGCPASYTEIAQNQESSALSNTRTSRYSGQDTRYGVSQSCGRVLTSCQDYLGLGRDPRAGNLEGFCTTALARVDYNRTNTQNNPYGGEPNRRVAGCLQACCTRPVPGSNLRQITWEQVRAVLNRLTGLFGQGPGR